MAVLSSAILMMFDLTPLMTRWSMSIGAAVSAGFARLSHAPLSAIPLLAAGAAYLAMQTILRPPPFELLKRAMLGAAFVLWGIVQMMPPSDLATGLGDLVITLYVVDLFMIIMTEVKRAHLVRVG